MIRMISGVYGMRVKQPYGGETVVAVGPDYGPFSLPPEKEKRLVDRKVAVYVEQPQQDGEPAPDEIVDTGTPIGFDETPPEDFADGAEDVAEVVEELVDLESLSMPELRNLGKQYGLTFKVGMTKQEMAAEIAAKQSEAVEDEDGEPAPVFDAAEAVQ